DPRPTRRDLPRAAAGGPRRRRRPGPGPGLVPCRGGRGATEAGRPPGGAPGARAVAPVLGAPVAVPEAGRGAPDLLRHVRPRPEEPAQRGLGLLRAGPLEPPAPPGYRRGPGAGPEEPGPALHHGAGAPGDGPRQRPPPGEPPGDRPGLRGAGVGGDDAGPGAL